MPSNPSCSIVIRAFNEEQHLEKLLLGLRQQTIVDPEIILVDSGSTDNTMNIANSYGVKVVQIDPQEFTFGRSLNLGISNTSGEIIVFASAHVYPVYPDWLEQLLLPFSDERIALTYGKQRGDANSKFSEHRVFAQWFPDSPHPIQSHPFCNNANAAIRKQLWEAYPYDETLPGLEDLDWANRIRLNGYQVKYVPEAEIIHVHNETPRGIFHRYQREGMAFKHIFPQETFSLMDFLRLSFTNIFHDLEIATAQKVLGRSWRSIIWFRLAQFWGTFQGYSNSGPLTWQLRQRFYYPHRVIVPKTVSSRSVDPIEYN